MPLKHTHTIVPCKWCAQHTKYVAMHSRCLNTSSAFPARHTYITQSAPFDIYATRCWAKAGGLWVIWGVGGASGRVGLCRITGFVCSALLARALCWCYIMKLAEHQDMNIWCAGWYVFVLAYTTYIIYIVWRRPRGYSANLLRCWWPLNVSAGYRALGMDVGCRYYMVWPVANMGRRAPRINIRTREILWAIVVIRGVICMFIIYTRILVGPRH